MSQIEPISHTMAMKHLLLLTTCLNNPFQTTPSAHPPPPPLSPHSPPKRDHSGEAHIAATFPTLLHFSECLRMFRKDFELACLKADNCPWLTGPNDNFASQDLSAAAHPKSGTKEVASFPGNKTREFYLSRPPFPFPLSIFTISELIFFVWLYIKNILLTEISRSVWENLDLGRVYRPHWVRSVLTTSVCTHAVISKYLRYEV